MWGRLKWFHEFSGCFACLAAWCVHQLGGSLNPTIKGLEEAPHVSRVKSPLRAEGAVNTSTPTSPTHSVFTYPPESHHAGINSNAAAVGSLWKQTGFFFPSTEENPQSCSVTTIQEDGLRRHHLVWGGGKQHSSLSWLLRALCPRGWKCSREFFGRNVFFLCDLKLQKSGKDFSPWSESDGPSPLHVPLTWKMFFTFQLIEKLKLILLETPSCDLESRTITQHQGSILRLQELLSQKVDVATELLLRVRVVFLLQH